MKTKPTDYHLTLRPMPGNYQSPEIRRMAQLLKTLGRRWGFKCVAITTAAGQAKGAGKDEEAGE